MGKPLTATQFKMLESCVLHGDSRFHLRGLAEHGGANGTRWSLQRRGYLDAECKITAAGLIAYGQAEAPAHG